MPPCGVSPIRDTALGRASGTTEVQTGREGRLGREGTGEIAQWAGGSQSLALTPRPLQRRVSLQQAGTPGISGWWFSDGTRRLRLETALSLAGPRCHVHTEPKSRRGWRSSAEF